MVASMDSVGNQPEVDVLLSTRNPENESRNQTSEQKRPSFSEHSGRSEQNGRTEETRVQMLEINGDAQNGAQQDTGVRDGMGNAVRRRLKCCKKVTAMKVTIPILVLLLVISGSYNWVQHAQKKELQAQVEKLQATTTSAPPLNASCPQRWIGDAERYCYFFSHTEDTWDSSRDHCSSAGGSLVTMATGPEKAFINENKDSAEYWLGLRRGKIGELWKQPDGSDFNNTQLDIKGDGLCATLNDGVQSSTDCDNRRNWICRKPLHGV